MSIVLKSKSDHKQQGHRLRATGCRLSWVHEFDSEAKVKSRSGGVLFLPLGGQRVGRLPNSSLIRNKSRALGKHCTKIMQPAKLSTIPNFTFISTDQTDFACLQRVRMLLLCSSTEFPQACPLGQLFRWESNLFAIKYK